MGTCAAAGNVMLFYHIRLSTPISLAVNVTGVFLLLRYTLNSTFVT
jgi:hypothetical protein